MTTILFVCVHNAGRSQLAAGLAAARAGGDVVIASAGTDPDEAVSATVLASLAEIGIDRRAEVPRRLTAEIAAGADLVIALKPGLDLPAHDRVETWSLPDPAEWDVDGVRPLREHIDGLVADLLRRESDQHRTVSAREAGKAGPAGTPQRRSVFNLMKSRRNGEV